jgi:light-regulated signal transduction histidine kinase (bacteriophytochrome)
MQPLLAKKADSTRFEDLGRATLHIVHDLKNQLNGLKLYATFLRKRMERDERPQDERETVVKLIAGLDRAAHDLTAIVRLAAPPELRRQPHVDLSKVISKAIDETGAGTLSEQSQRPAIDGMKPDIFLGEFDSAALIGAFKTFIDHVVGAQTNKLPSLRIRRDDAQASGALIEWRNIDPPRKEDPFRALDSIASVRMALAARIIEAHGGRVEQDRDALRVWLPLT